MSFIMIIWHQNRVKQTSSFFLWILTASFLSLKQIIFKDIGGYVEKWFDTLNYDERRRKTSFPVEKNKTIIGFMKVEKGGQIVTNITQRHQRHMVEEFKKMIIK